MAEAELKAAMAELGLTVEAEFIPFSRSRNKDERHPYPSLNWRVTLFRGPWQMRDNAESTGTKRQEVLSCDYSAGCGHAPSYKQRMTVAEDACVKWECEHGYRAHYSAGGNIMRAAGGKPLKPNSADVVHSLVLDASAIDHSSFESWASDYGYDTDSRKAEAAYRACLDIGLKLRNAIGDDGVRKLQEASQNY